MSKTIKNTYICPHCYTIVVSEENHSYAPTVKEIGLWNGNGCEACTITIPHRKNYGYKPLVQVSNKNEKDWIELLYL